MIAVDPASIAPDADPAAPPADGARALIDEQLAMLSRLARIGMEVAEACGRQAANAPADVGPVFARVARAVRMTIALQSRLLKDLADLAKADARAEQSRKDTHRIRLSRLVGQAARAGVEAQRHAGTRRWSGEDAIEDEIERVSYDAYERLTEAEDGDLMGRSFDEVVVGICKDLGLSPEWTARVASAVQAPHEAERAAPDLPPSGGSPGEAGDGGIGTLDFAGSAPNLHRRSARARPADP